MKKFITFGAAALAFSLFASPLAAEAGNRNITVIKVGGKNCIKWESIIWNGNCPTLPSKPGDTTPPENPETPEDSVKPDDSTKPEDSVKPDDSNKPGDSTAPEITFAERVVELVNEERAKEGLHALTIDQKIESAALVRAKEIQTSFSHTRPNGSSFATALKEAGVSYRGAGENIAWGQRSPEAVVDAWMNSAGHRANILNRNYTKIGVGHLQNASGTSYWAQLFAY